MVYGRYIKLVHGVYEPTTLQYVNWHRFLYVFIVRSSKLTNQVDQFLQRGSLVVLRCFVQRSGGLKTDYPPVNKHM
jgi:hypothetical protein